LQVGLVGGIGSGDPVFVEDPLHAATTIVPTSITTKSGLCVGSVPLVRSMRNWAIVRAESPADRSSATAFAVVATARTGRPSADAQSAAA
jgi:hypothetical protein